MAWNERYSRQIAFKGVGEEGQEKLSKARVLIVGAGALGSVIANNLCRAGVGFLRLVDRDYVELSNLQRQVIYNEQDVKENLPKAVAAVNHLQKVNSDITLEPVVCDVNGGNIEKLMEGIDLVLDGTDNMETRLLVNDACQKLQIPWVYGGALMSYGMSMNIIPGETACFRCFNPNIPPPGSMPTCSSAGVLSMITGIIACIESTEALKILTGSPEVRKNLFVIDIWNNSADYVEIAKNPECPTCGQKQYEFLESMKGSYTAKLCGRDSVQVVPAHAGEVDLKAVAEKLKNLGTVKVNPFLLKFTAENIEISLFKDGRAIIKSAKDENMAKSIYAEYIGL